jgi:hypothetical protein
LPIRDTVLFGPTLIIVSNWVYAHVVSDLPQQLHERLVLGMLAAFGYWAIYAAFVFVAMPMIPRMLDRR